MPTYTFARQKIAALRRLDLKRVPIESVAKQVSNLLVGLRVMAPTLNVGVPVYRGVIWAQKPTLISQLSYPPSDRVRQLQRANQPHDPRFYGSSTNSAPLFELRPKEGDKVVISQWRVVREFVVNPVGYFGDTLKRFSSDRAEMREFNPRLEQPAARIVQEFLANEFTQEVPAGEEHRYKISAAIADCMLASSRWHETRRFRILQNIMTQQTHLDQQPTTGRSRPVGGLIYPALAMRANAENLCFPADIADAHLRFSQAEYVRVDAVLSSLSLRVASLDYANAAAPDGTLQWLGMPSPLGDMTAKFDDAARDRPGERLRVVVADMPRETS